MEKIPIKYPQIFLDCSIMFFFKLQIFSAAVLAVNQIKQQIAEW